MKERPILFSAPMVRAILEGRKTQTRRPVKPAYVNNNGYRLHEVVHGDQARKLTGPNDRAYVGFGHPSSSSIEYFGCPYGQPGDRLWVREPWRTEARYDHLSPAALPADARIWYLADGEPAEPGAGRYRHARFMPRRFARITLEITGVRVERLNEISEADAAAEGVDFGNTTDPLAGEIDCDATEAFENLWESINGPGSWEANPWVWVVEFAPLAPVGR